MMTRYVMNTFTLGSNAVQKKMTAPFGLQRCCFNGRTLKDFSCIFTLPAALLLREVGYLVILGSPEVRLAVGLLAGETEPQI